MKMFMDIFAFLFSPCIQNACRRSSCRRLTCGVGGWVEAALQKQLWLVLTDYCVTFCQNRCGYGSSAAL